MADTQRDDRPCRVEGARPGGRDGQGRPQRPRLFGARFWVWPPDALPWRRATYTVLDLELTGLDPAVDAIVAAGGCGSSAGGCRPPAPSGCWSAPSGPSPSRRPRPRPAARRAGRRPAAGRSAGRAAGTPGR